MDNTYWYRIMQIDHKTYTDMFTFCYCCKCNRRMFLESSEFGYYWLYVINFGEDYDGARAMSGEFHGVQAYVSKKYKLALYSHCTAHSFDLWQYVNFWFEVYIFFIPPKDKSNLKMSLNFYKWIIIRRTKKNLKSSVQQDE